MLHLHRAERADRLVDALGTVLTTPPADPFAREVVAVPTRGMERWLTQRLSGRLGAAGGRADGICANVDFPSPHRLVGDAVASASGIDPVEDRWLPERLVWPLLEVVEECLAEDWLAPLHAHLDPATDPTRRGRRFATLRHLADLYDRYALHRPEMVLGWAAGRERDGDLPVAARWQAELWRHLRAHVGQPDPAERLAAACEQVRARPDAIELPDRLAVFGLTRLPAGHLRVLRAIAATRELHLLLLHPSPVLWERVAQAVQGGSTPDRRRDDPTATLPSHPLLGSWARDAREMQLVLAADPEQEEHHHSAASAADAATLLGRIQADVRADAEPPGSPLPGAPDARFVLASEDASVEIHACHGRARQVEVLRDAVLRLLQDDPGLEPRDVIVLCPDVEAFAPLVHATFGAGAADEDEDAGLESVPAEWRPPDLRVRLADRALRQTNPLLGVVAHVLELAEARVTASQVLDLADRDPVRRRFRLDDDDLQRLQDWTAQSGVRWGLDAAHRAPFRLDVLAAGTWRAGLDRVLTGVAMTEADQRLVGGTLPLDDVESGAIDLAGRFAELVHRLDASLSALREPKPIDEWATALATAADALAVTAPRDAWQRAELEWILADVTAEAATTAGAEAVELVPAELRALLADRLAGRPTRANFRTGHLTVCTLMPMRSVPHRVVCLLGLDDAAFPRRAPRDGDDLVLEEPQVGDRDGRSEDRQLLLDALLAAEERLIVTYTGNDERTNAERPPAVPVGELLEVVDRTARTPTGETASARVITRHPLQPFDPRNFTGALRSFDRASFAGARALVGRRGDPPPFLAGPLSDPAFAEIVLETLVRFVEHPVKAFLRERLGLSLADYAQELDDELPVALDGLESWGVGDRILAARLAGVERRQACVAEMARGSLPPGELGAEVLKRVVPVTDALLAEAQSGGGEGEPGSVDVRLALADGRTLVGTVSGVAGEVLRTVSYSRVGPKHRLAAWVRHLALSAARPERALTTVLLGRARRGAGRSAETTTVTLAPLGADAATRRTVALEHLAVVLDLFDRGMREPPPLACGTSAAYAAGAPRGPDAARRAAVKAWKSEWSYDREDREPEHRLVLGGERSFAELEGDPARLDESGPGWDGHEPRRFGRWAVRLWAPLLDHERIVDA